MFGQLIKSSVFKKVLASYMPFEILDSLIWDDLSKSVLFYVKMTQALYIEMKASNYQTCWSFLMGMTVDIG